MPQGNQIANETVQLQVSDGSRMAAYTARPAGQAALPGMIVLQEAFGVNSHIRNVTDRIADQGFVAIAPELFHRTAPGFQATYTDFASTMPHMQAMTVPGTEADLGTAFEWLRSNPGVKKDEIYSVGFCMGGRMSFLANSVLPLRAAVSFYGGRIAPDLLDRASRLHGRMLFFWGKLDHHISPEQRKAVIDALDTQKKTYVNVEFSNADHGFFCDERAAYQPEAARLAWSLMLEFLRS